MKKERTDCLSALFLHVLIARLGQPAFFHITQWGIAIGSLLSTIDTIPCRSGIAHFLLF